MVMAKNTPLKEVSQEEQGGAFQAWTSTILILSEVCGEVPKNVMEANEPEQCAVEL